MTPLNLLSFPSRGNLNHLPWIFMTWGLPGGGMNPAQRGCVGFDPVCQGQGEQCLILVSQLVLQTLAWLLGAPNVAKTNVTSGAEPQRHWASLLMLQLPPIYHLSIQLRGGLLVLCAGYTCTSYRIISFSRNSQSKLRQDCSERSRKNWKRGGRKMGNRNLAPILSFLALCLFVWGKRSSFLEWSPSTSHLSPVYICQYLVLILHL